MKMDRRKFISHLVAGAAGTTGGIALAKLTPHPKEVKQNRSVVYQVGGFTCMTCATGLEVTLLKHDGVAQVDASYPKAEVSIGFDRDRISEEELRQIIERCGFLVT